MLNLMKLANLRGNERTEYLADLRKDSVEAALFVATVQMLLAEVPLHADHDEQHHAAA